jgi:hypothetical protein
MAKVAVTDYRGDKLIPGNTWCRKSRKQLGVLYQPMRLDKGTFEKLMKLGASPF